MKKIPIKTEYITLGQLLKLINIIQSGGEAKMYLLMNDIYVNDEKEIRRGRKIYPNDFVKIESQEYMIINHETR